MDLVDRFGKAPFVADVPLLRERHAAWLDDTYGVEIVLGGIPMLFVLVPLFILGLAWFILPK